MLKASQYFCVTIYWNNLIMNRYLFSYLLVALSWFYTHDHSFQSQRTFLHKILSLAYIYCLIGCFSYIKNLLIYVIIVLVMSFNMFFVYIFIRLTYAMILLFSILISYFDLSALSLCLYICYKVGTNLLNSYCSHQ